MKSQWKRGEFEIHQNAQDKKRVNGIIHHSGIFAIECGCYRVTHIPTGLLISPYMSGFKLAKAFAESLARHNVDWSKLTNDNCHDFRAGGMTLKELVNKIFLAL